MIGRMNLFTMEGVRLMVRFQKEAGYEEVSAGIATHETRSSAAP